jgi:hypothetical protein
MYCNKKKRGEHLYFKSELAEKNLFQVFLTLLQVAWHGTHLCPSLSHLNDGNTNAGQTFQKTMTWLSSLQDT